MTNEHQDRRRQFSGIAAHYDRHAIVQREVADRLLERLDGINFQPESVLDIGCATGRQTRALQARFPGARVVGLDLAQTMLGRARRQQGWWRKRFELVTGDVEALPLAEASIDLVHSSMTLEWCRDLSAALSSIRRVIRPGGMLLMATTGPDTLRDLRRILENRDMDMQAGGMIDAMRLGDALVRSGFQEPVIDTDWLTATHDDPTGLLDDLAHTGAQFSRELDREALQHDYAEFRDEQGKYPATWEIVYASAWAPEEGQPIRTESGEEASISIANLGIRKRR